MPSKISVHKYRNVFKFSKKSQLFLGFISKAFKKISFYFLLFILFD